MADRKEAAEAIVAQLRNLQDAEDMCQGLLLNIRRSKEGLQQALAVLTAAAPVFQNETTSDAVAANGRHHPQALFSPKAHISQSLALGRSMAMSHSQRAKPRVMAVASPVIRQAPDTWNARPQSAVSNHSSVAPAASSIRSTSIGSMSATGRPQSVSSAFELDRGESQSIRGGTSPQRTSNELTMDMLAQDYKHHAQTNGSSLRVDVHADNGEQKPPQGRQPLPLPLSPRTDESGHTSSGALSPILRQSSEAMATAGLHLARMDESMRMAMDAAAQAGYSRSPVSKSLRQRVSFASDSTSESAPSRAGPFSVDSVSSAAARQASIDDALSRLRQLASRNTIQVPSASTSDIPSALEVHTSNGTLERLSGNISSLHSEASAHAEAAFTDLMEALSKI